MFSLSGLQSVNCTYMEEICNKAIKSNTMQMWAQVEYINKDFINIQCIFPNYFTTYSWCRLSQLRPTNLQIKTLQNKYGHIYSIKMSLHFNCQLLQSNKNTCKHKKIREITIFTTLVLASRGHSWANQKEQVGVLGSQSIIFM